MNHPNRGFNCGVIGRPCKSDITLSLLRMISYNISHIATMTAVKHGLKRIFFGGYFIRGHAYTMNTISFAVDYWSKGQLKAMFLRHEGFLGALGAFLQDVQAQALRSTPLQGGIWLEKFIKCSMPPPHIGRLRREGSVAIDSVEKKTEGTSSRGDSGNGGERAINVNAGTASLAEATRRMVMHVRSMSADEETLGELHVAEEEGTDAGGTRTVAHSVPKHGEDGENGRGDADGGSVETETGSFDPSQNQLLGKAGLQVGVLHLVPTLKPFPLLRWPDRYEPNIIDMLESREEREYWLDTLHRLSPGLVEKAVASEAALKEGGDSEDTLERGEAFHAVFAAHLDRLREEPAAYGRIGLSGLFEMREECLRAFGFSDAYFLEKQRENAAALAVLPDLLAELDGMKDEERLLALVEGVLAGNIFDWGSQSCVNLYKNGTILDIYRNARSSVTRPWAVDCFDMLNTRLIGTNGGAEQGDSLYRAETQPHQYRKALLFCDNSGADVVLGMIPFARELLRRGTDVCLVANSLPAINDVTAEEMREVVLLAAEKCDILAKALKTSVAVADDNNLISAPHLTTGSLTVCASGSGSPCLDFRRISSELCEAAQGVDLLVLEGMGRAVHTNYAAAFRCDTLKLAMIKNSRLAERLFNGRIYDCVCKFELGDDDNADFT